MDRYTKAFVVASLVYFVAAAALGIWMGAGGAPEWAWFGHVHFNLMGFMAMMIYGVGYFVLPRFNARPLIWPAGLPLHFFIANIGLIGMVATYPGRPSAEFLLFSLLSVLSAVLFAANLGATVVIPLKEEAAAGKKAASPPSVTPRTRMGEIISRWPQTVGVLVRNGFAPLADPAHQEKVKQLPVTLEMACANHHVDLEMMVGLLNDAIAGGSSETAPGGPFPAAGSIASADVIGDVLARYPSTEKVFRKYYGAACFSCPGQATETIRQSALMHNANEEDLLSELNAAVGEVQAR